MNFTDVIYLAIPFIAWLTSGCIKFLVNCIRYGSEAKKMMGYGGFPSTHTAILSSVVFFIGFKSGFNTPLFTLGVGTLIILIIDAHGLRRKIGEQAVAINNINKALGIDCPLLREKMGHSWFEILGGLICGCVIGYVAAWCIGI